MAILDVPDGEAVTRELLRREIIVDHRPGAGIRYSPHFYTTDDEILRAIDETREILDSGAYRAHLRAGRDGLLSHSGVVPAPQAWLDDGTSTAGAIAVKH